MRFNLNGNDVGIPPLMAEDRLLWLLRDHFALNGAKFGCGVGACGACVVHVNGVAERACLIQAADVAGKTVVTLEGLGVGQPNGLHPVQQAWLEASVPQCGYCQNGQIMTAAALLAANPAANAEDIAAAMDDVICRCGTQQRIKA
ncbi:MAG: (2Fe-2S)-binding protein, partial [Notoacmeibacter sp.]